MNSKVHVGKQQKYNALKKVKNISQYMWTMMLRNSKSEIKFIVLNSMRPETKPSFNSCVLVLTEHRVSHRETLKYFLSQISTMYWVPGEIIFVPDKISVPTLTSHAKCKINQLKSLWLGFPGGTVVENLPANAGDTGSSPGLGRSHMPRSN